MEVEDFELERWFAKHEHDAEIMLAESGIRSLDVKRFDLDIGKMNYVIPTDGDPDLRDQVAERYDRKKDEILFTVGTQEANFLVFLSMLDEEDHVVAITPTYQALHSVPNTFGAVTKVSLEPPRWELSIEKVKDAVDDETKLVVLNNPNNPTGRYHPKSKVDALLDIVEDNDAYLLCDEVYRLLVDDPLPPVAKMSTRGISTTSLTKSYGLAGARFGWLCGPEEIVENAWGWKDYTTISPTVLGQHIAKQALGEMEKEILSKNRRLADRNRELVQEFIDKHGLNWYEPVGVNGFVSVPDEFQDSVEFCKSFVKDYGVVLAPGKVFGHDDYFRIGYGMPTPELKEGLSRLDDYLAKEK